MKGVLVLLVFTARLAAQVPGSPGSETAVRLGPTYETYTLGAGLAFDRVSELSIPLTLSQRFGSRLTVDAAAAFATASAHLATGEEVSFSGLTDTDIRAAIAVVPGRFILTLVGTLPTGKKAVPDSALPVLGALATDLLEFATPSFGSGGAVTAGFATATKLGTWAIGAGASYRYSATFTPVSGGGDLKPGDEGRARLGVEGPFGGGKYLRAALMYTLSQHDDLSGGAPSITGDRVLGYMQLSMPVGKSSLTLYTSDVLRLRPRTFSTTSTTVVEIPRGNLFAVGARLERALSPRATLVPGIELRHELVALVDSTGMDSGFQPFGLLVRPGVDLRYRMSAGATFVLQGRLAVGSLKDQNRNSVSLLGPRLAAVVEWMR